METLIISLWEGIVHLTAMVTLMGRDRRTPKMVKQILMYTVIGFHQLDVNSIYPSYSKNAEGFGVTNTHMGLFGDLYVEKSSSVCVTH